jgi:ankyrin repeat protein
LSKDNYNNKPWHLAAEEGKVEILEKLWEWYKVVQIKPEEIRNQVVLSKDFYNNTPWHIVAEEGKVEILDKLWEWAKEL